MWVDINSEIVKEEQAVISVFDHGFLYGVGCFETLRTYNGHPFLFHDHFERLLSSLAVFGIQTGRLDKDDLIQRIAKLIDRNGFQDGYVRISVSAGIAPLGLPKEQYTEPNVIIMCKPLPPQLLRGELIVKKLRISPINRNSPDWHIRLKSFQYGNNIIAAQHMKLGPEEEGLFLTEDGMLSEGLVSNIFFIKDGCLYTPSTDTGILNGITRKFVMKLAQLNGIEVREGRYTLSQVAEATEIFMTNSVQELVPVIAIDNIWAEQSASFPITLKLLTSYRTFTDHLLSREELEREME